MKFKSINFIFVCAMFLILNACTKESTTLETTQTTTAISSEKDMALEFKEYYPPEEVDVTEKVLGFLNHTKTYNPEASFKTAFKDMEVNEAMFTLEAASNYLVNKNMKYRRDLKDSDVSFKITLGVNSNGQIDGTKLVEEFESLHKAIDKSIEGKNRVPQLINYELSRSINNSIIFDVMVVIGTKVLLSGGFDEMLRPERCSTNGIFKIGNYCINQHIPTGGETSVNEVAQYVVDCLDDTGWNGNYYYTNLSLSSTGNPKTVFVGHQSSDAQLIRDAGELFMEYLNADICAFNTPENIYGLSGPLWGNTFAMANSYTYENSQTITWTMNSVLIGRRIFY